MWGKPKKYNPDKLEISFRVMTAEMKMQQKKQQQVIDNLSRRIAADVNRKDKDGIYDKAYKIAEAKLMLQGFELCTDAMKTLKENKAEAVESRKGPTGECEEAFRILCTAAKIVKIDSFTKFLKEVQGKEMFDKGVGLDLSNIDKADPRVKEYFIEKSHDDEEITAILREVGQGIIGDLAPLEEVLGVSLEEKQEEPAPSPAEIPTVSYPQPNQVPPAGAVPPPAFGFAAPNVEIPSDIKEHEDLFTPIDLEPFDRQNWARIVEEVVGATA